MDRREADQDASSDFEKASAVPAEPIGSVEERDVLRPPIRVLCCSGSLEGGGSERQLWQLATRMNRSRFSPHFYLHYRRGKYLEQIPPGVPIHHFWPQAVGDREAGFEHNGGVKMRLPGQIHREQVRHLCSVIRQERIAIVYDRTFHMTLVTGSACRATQTPRVSVIVSPPSQDFVRSEERFAWIKKRLLRRNYMDPHATTVAVSRSVADDASVFYNIPRDRITVIASPIDHEAVETAARAADQPDWNADGLDHICVVGRLSEEKGQRFAVEAFAKAIRLSQDANWRLDIVGDGPERKQLERLVSDLGIQSQVQFWGFLENPYPIIRAAKLLVIPSRYEGFPNVALEAMTLETAVLATDCSGSLTELLSERDLGQIVGVDNVEQMAKAMVDRFVDSDQWNHRRARAQRIVREQYGLQAWLKRMEELFLAQLSRPQWSSQA